MLKERCLFSSIKGLRFILVGGAQFPGWLREKCLNSGLPIVPSYGSSELCSHIAAVPLKSASSMILDSDGKVLNQVSYSIGEKGDLTITTNSGYIATIVGGKLIPAISPYKTRDLAMDLGDGFIKILGRSDRVFISGGENIHPEQVEQFLLKISGVIEARVTARKDRRWGQVGHAELNVAKQVDKNSILNEISKNIPSFMQPKSIDFNYIGKDIYE